MILRLQGPPGEGKTTMLAFIANKLHQIGILSQTVPAHKAADEHAITITLDPAQLMLLKRAGMETPVAEPDMRVELLTNGGLPGGGSVELTIRLMLHGKQYGFSMPGAIVLQEQLTRAINNAHIQTLHAINERRRKDAKPTGCACGAVFGTTENCPVHGKKRERVPIACTKHKAIGYQSTCLQCSWGIRD